MYAFKCFYLKYFLNTIFKYSITVHLFHWTNLSVTYFVFNFLKYLWASCCEHFMDIGRYTSTWRFEQNSISLSFHFCLIFSYCGINGRKNGKKQSSVVIGIKTGICRSSIHFQSNFFEFPLFIKGIRYFWSFYIFKDIK